MRCFGGVIGAGLWGLCVLICVALFLSACVTGDSLVSKFKEVEDAMNYSSNGNDARLQLIKSMQSSVGRGLHSFTSQLNLSASCGTGGARKGCVTRVQGVFRVCRVSVFLCQTRLKLS